jgi:hypothetical protein
LVWGGVGTEDADSAQLRQPEKVEGWAGSSWADRLRSPAGELGLVFGAGSAGGGGMGRAVRVGEAWEIGTPGALPSPGVL